MLRDYIIKEKSNIDKAREDITTKTFNELGYTRMYQVGSISMIENLLKIVKKKTDSINRDDLLFVLKEFKKDDMIDKDVITYINALIDEYDSI